MHVCLNTRSRHGLDKQRMPRPQLNLRLQTKPFTQRNNACCLIKSGGAHNAALIGEGAVAADQGVPRDGLPKHLHAQHVRHQLLRLLRTAQQRGVG